LKINKPITKGIIIDIHETSKETYQTINNKNPKIVAAICFLNT
jgi:hypothetical protein